MVVGAGILGGAALFLHRPPSFEASLARYRPLSGAGWPLGDASAQVSSAALHSSVGTLPAASDPPVVASSTGRAAEKNDAMISAPRPKPADDVGPKWEQLPLDWSDTPLGPGYPNMIHAAWSDLGVLTAGTVLRVEAEGFNGEDGPIAGWGWYLNVWSGDGRHWDKKSNAFRILHFNPRPRAGIIAMNHCLRSGWGPEKDAPIPEPWQLTNAAKPFVLELELDPKAWSVKLNGESQPDMGYDRQGEFSEPLILQLYDLLQPRLSILRGGRVVEPPQQAISGGRWKRLPIDWKDTQLGPGYPTKIKAAWTDLGVMTAGNVLRIEADGFNGKFGPIASWGWYLNVWSGDGRHWTKKPDAYRLLHLNPRPRGGSVAMNHCLNTGWGPQKDVPVPKAWKLANSAKPFVLEMELGPTAWSMKLNGELQPGMAYERKGDFSRPLLLQLYDVTNPRVSLKIA
mmetsp:Transcript_16666/g.53704  ORF Transcript_16666/g.53704 Transcript_16666/m.53704 type:complete len:455 (+) Transcript_16666:175-1539(+)